MKLLCQFLKDELLVNIDSTDSTVELDTSLLAYFQSSLSDELLIYYLLAVVYVGDAKRKFFNVKRKVIFNICSTLIG